MVDEHQGRGEQLTLANVIDRIVHRRLEKCYGLLEASTGTSDIQSNYDTITDTGVVMRMAALFKIESLSFGSWW